MRSLAVLGLLLAAPAAAQEFAPVAPEPFAGGALAMLATGVAAGERAAMLEAAAGEWWGVPELEAGAFAASGRVGGVTAAAGVARFGDAAIGWHAAALAVGAAHPAGGAGLRAVVRQDRGAAAAVSLEAGGGAWAGAGALRVFVSAPQLWTDGPAPPLVGPLETGAEWRTRGGAAWAAFAAAPARDADTDRRLGACLVSGPLEVWAEALAPPWRAGAGAAFTLGSVHVSAGFVSHPVLGETTRIALAFGTPRQAR